jgi:hypothetical protein
VGERKPGYASIVFSMDRPLQLEALLRSISKTVEGLSRLIVLYKASDERFASAYEEVIALHGGADRRFAREVDAKPFKEALLEILEALEQERVFFLVDDIVFMKDTDLSAFDPFDLRRFVPSLRLGSSISYSYNLGKSQAKPRFRPRRGGLLSWRWARGDIDWGYPLSLDGNMFDTQETLEILRSLSFRSPNTLEAAMQDAIGRFLSRRGLCFEAPRIVNIPCNRVQNDFANRHSDLADPVQLLDAWKRGFRADLSVYASRDWNSVHMDWEIVLERRPPA